MKAQDLRKVFTKLLGFTHTRTNGSHAVFRHPEGAVTVLRADKKEICNGTLAEIFRQADADHLAGVKSYREAEIAHMSFLKDQEAEDKSAAGQEDHRMTMAGQGNLTDHQAMLFELLPYRARQLILADDQDMDVYRDLCAAKQLYEDSDMPNEQRDALELFVDSYYHHGGREIVQTLHKQGVAWSLDTAPA